MPCMQDTALLKLLLTYPRALGMSVDRTLAPAVSVLEGLGYSKAGLARIVVQQPAVLSCKAERLAEIMCVMQDFGLSKEVSSEACLPLCTATPSRS